jgi:hypothetical protein
MVLQVLIKQVKQQGPEQHTAKANVANHPIVHLPHQSEHITPAAGIDEGDQSFDYENKRNCHWKYLPEVQNISLMTSRAQKTASSNV